MRALYDLFYELYPLVSGISSLCLAQLLKLLYSYLRSGRFSIRPLVSSGGMPSSHSAMVIGLTTAIGLKEGWTSSLFCMAAIFSLVVLYDASGVRRAVGKHTGIINQMIDNFLEKGEFRYEKLSEFLGHTPLEVLIGSLLGIAVAFSLFY